MNYTFTLQQEHFEQLKSHLLRDDNLERAAFIILGTGITENETRYLSRELILLDNQDLISNSETHVTFDNNKFIDVLKKAELKGFSVALVHNHPDSFRNFSGTDDEGEKSLFRLAFNRNRSRVPYPSIILFPDEELMGRVWNEDLQNFQISKFRIYGKKIQLLYPNKNESFESREEFNRQALAFGNALNQDFANMKVSVVGCGGTGSATAILLARLGVSEICLIDKDKLEKSNINRLHGSTLDDVGTPKVDILEKEINRIGLETKVTKVENWVNSKEAVEELKSSDIIFGCTDDHMGRIILNRFAYFYLTPVIDMGLVIRVSDSNPPEIRDLITRVSYLYPGSDCLLTTGNIDIEMAYAESVKQSDNEEYERLKEEAYVIGEGNPAPAVVTFTTQLATVAINSMINRMVGFNPYGMHPHELNFLHRNTQILPQSKEDEECKVCGIKIYWGRGDMLPFLDTTM